MKTIAVYGSLKAGRYNHGILKGSFYLGTTKVRGTLYLVSSYPALIEEGDNEYDAEVYEVPEDIYHSVRGMELGAGYKELEVTCLLTGTLLTIDAIVYYADTYLEQRCKDRYKVISLY